MNIIKNILKSTLSLIIFLIIAIAPWFFLNFNIIGYLFLSFAISLGVFEIFQLKKEGKTISESFWVFSKQNKSKARILLICSTFGWLMIMLHLGVELF